MHWYCLLQCRQSVGEAPPFVPLASHLDLMIQHPMDDVDLLNYSAPNRTFHTFALRQRASPPHPNARDNSKSTGTSIGSGKLDLSTQETIARNGLLRESVFPDWEDDAARSGSESPCEMQ